MKMLSGRGIFGKKSLAIVLLLGVAGCRTIVIHSEPSGTTVTSQSNSYKSYGITPYARIRFNMFERLLSLGEDVTVAKDGYESTNVTIKSSMPSPVLIQLKEGDYEISVDSNPQGATVVVQGQGNLGRTPMKFKDRLEKPIMITVSKNEYESKSVMIDRRSERRVMVRLRKVVWEDEAWKLVKDELSFHKYSTARQKLIAWSLEESNNAERREAAFRCIHKINAMGYEYFKSEMTAQIDQLLDVGNYAAARRVLADEKMWTVEVVPDGMRTKLADLAGLMESIGSDGKLVDAQLDKFMWELQNLFKCDIEEDNAADYVKQKREQYDRMVEALAEELTKFNDNHWKINGEQKERFVKMVHDGFDPLINTLTKEEARKRGKSTITSLGLSRYAKRVSVLRISLLRKVLVRQVKDAINAGRLDDARTAIYEFGTVGDPFVDERVAVVKVGLLNSYVNPRCYDLHVKTMTEKTNEFWEKEEYQRAINEISKFKPFPVASKALDGAYSAVTGAAVKLEADMSGAAKASDESKRNVEELIASRIGKYLFDESRQEELTALLDELCKELYRQDLTLAKAEEIVKDLEKKLRALIGKSGMLENGATVMNLTTKELNEKIQAWNQAEIDNLREIIKWKEEQSAKAEEERRKALVEKAKKIEQIKIARDKYLEQLRKEREAMLEKFRSELDIAHYLALAEDAIAKEPENPRGRINAIMIGEYARVLRTLRRNGLEFINPADAMTAFAVAGYLGHAQIVDFTLKNGAKVNGVPERDPLKRSPLMWAVEGGNCELVSSLLAAGADVGYTDANGATALISSAYMGDSQSMAALIKAHSKLEACSSDNKDTPFLAAVRGFRNCHGQIRVLEMLRLSGADMTVVDAWGDQALAIAARQDNVEVTKWLLAQRDAKSEPIYPVETRNRALEHAAANANAEVAACLIAAGAEASADMLKVAALTGDVKIVRMFVEFGVDVQVVETACGDEVVKYLYSQGNRAIKKANVIGTGK